MVVHKIKRGLDLPLAGAPAQQIEAGTAVRRVALLGADTVALRPSFVVQPGDRVRRGQALFEDKKNPGVRYTSPAAGTVKEIHRGLRRAFQSIAIDVDGDDGDDAQVDFAAYRGAAPESLDGDAVRALLVESGLWTALRTRPFSKVPSPTTTPRAIFVTAIDTRPHAPAVTMALSGREADFRTGIAALKKLTDGPVHVCVAPDSSLAVADVAGVESHAFDGPHPAGNAGTHIHWLEPTDLHRTVWHVGYQDVAAIGRLLATGRLDVDRVVSLAGPGVARPRLVRTRLGASIDDLVAGELRAGAQRTISGSVLDGRTASGDAEGWLGRYHLQVSAVPEAVERELFGWIDLGRRKFSIWRVVAGALAKRPLALTTSTNGGSRSMVPIGSYERVMPLNLMPTFLLRALLMGNDEGAERLGALELDEEDLALCTFVCPGKAEYGPLLRESLNRIEKEAA